MTTEEYTQVQAAMGAWAATTLSRLLPTLKENGIISAQSLETATTELENRKNELPADLQGKLDILLQRLRAPYGSGHLG